MKKLMLIFLCFFASNAYASSADSGRFPWKMPFRIHVHASGSMSSYQNFVPTHGQPMRTGYPTIPDSIEFDLIIDTSIASLDTISYFQDSSKSLQYSLTADTLRFFSDYETPYHSYLSSAGTSLIIAFAPGKDSILSLTGYTTSQMGEGQYITDFIVNTISISSLMFDDTSIYAAVSSGLVTSSETQSLYTNPGYPEFGYFTYKNFTESSVTLSGIFRPTTFSNPPAIVTETPQLDNLAIYSSNGSIACSFDVSDHERNLEIFSPLGIKEASFNISPGQTEASLPHLPDGFYFVRLGGSLAKIYVAE
jgi:hypothetical protein